MTSDPTTVGLLLSGYAAMGGVVIYIFRWAVGVAKAKDAELAAAKKEHADDLKRASEARVEMQLQMVRAIETAASAARELGGETRRQTHAIDRTTDVIGTVLQDLVRKAMNDPQMRKSLSVDKIPALIQRLRDDREDT